MTVPVTIERNNYTGNGTTATYAYGFRITAQTHLKVTVADEDGAETELAIGTDYTVTGVGVKTGGNIVLVDDSQDWIDDDGYLATGWDMSIRHYVPLTQSTDIRNQGTFYPEIHEDAFDYLMWAIKQQQDELNRCLKSGETETDPPTLSDLTDAVSAASDYADEAEAAKNGAETAKTNAETAETNAEAAQAAAEEAAASIPAKASQAQAEAGVADDVYMTPLKTAQAIAALAEGAIKSDGTVGIANLIYNGRFDYWLAGTTVAPTEWTADVNGGTIAQDGTYFKLGTYSMKLISPAGDTAAAYQYVGDYVALRGRKVTLSCWVKCSSASKAFIRVGDSAGYTDSAYHTGGGNWELLTVTRTIDASATNVYARPVVGSGTITAYFDGVMMTEGEALFAYSPAPLKHGTWISRTSGTVYYASCDGHVVGCRNSSGDAVSISVKTDAGNPPATIRQNTVKMADENIGHLSCPVKKGDYWNADNCTGTAGFVYFIPWIN